MTIITCISAVAMETKKEEGSICPHTPNFHLLLNPIGVSLKDNNLLGKHTHCITSTRCIPCDLAPCHIGHSLSPADDAMWGCGAIAHIQN